MEEESMGEKKTEIGILSKIQKLKTSKIIKPCKS